MESDELRKISASWTAGYFELSKSESRVIGFYEGRESFDEKNSIFIDSPYSDLRKEEIEDELNSLLADTCFRRSEDDDVSTGSSYALGFDADLDSPDLRESILKIVKAT